MFEAQLGVGGVIGRVHHVAPSEPEGPHEGVVSVHVLHNPVALQGGCELHLCVACISISPLKRICCKFHRFKFQEVADHIVE